MRTVSSRTIQPVTVPRAAVTDARSFLAHGIPALTLMGPSQGPLPHDLHPYRDRRSRLLLAALEHAVDFLAAVVTRIDRQPLSAFPIERAARARRPTRRCS